MDCSDPDIQIALGVLLGVWAFGILSAFLGYCAGILISRLLNR